MKEIKSLLVLKNELQSNEDVWLLLYKQGSTQSDCAFKNFVKTDSITKKNALLHANTNKVRDIHPEYNITSVPTLINFENGQLKNIVKGCYQPEQFNAIFEKSSFTATVRDEKKPQKSVTVYTTPTCTWCTTIKRHLQENGIQYREIDVSADQKAVEDMVRKSGQQGVPQTDINGEMIVGFDKTRINTLLGIN